MENVRTLLQPLREASERATKGPWTVPHLSQDDVDCDCASVLAEGYFGEIASIGVHNGIQNVTDGSNDCPPLPEAKANGYLISTLRNTLPLLLAAVDGLPGWQQEREGGR